MCRHAPRSGRRGLYKPHGWLPARSAGRTSTTSASSWSSPASARAFAASTAPFVPARSPAPREAPPRCERCSPPPPARNRLVRSRRLVGRARGRTAGRRARVARRRDRRGRSSRRDDGAPRDTRGGDATEPTVRPQALAPPARYAADSADRVRALTVAVQKRSVPQVRYTLLAASRSADVPRAARVMTVSTRTRTHAPKAVLHARHGTGGKTPTASSGSGGNGSSRPGWGHGDKNHSHSGPSKHKSSGSSKHSTPAKQQEPQAQVTIRFTRLGPGPK